MAQAPSSYAAGSAEEAAAKLKDAAIARTMFGHGPLTEKGVMDLPKHQQHQGALEHQLGLLILAANRLGLYDAADYLTRRK